MSRKLLVGLFTASFIASMLTVGLFAKRHGEKKGASKAKGKFCSLFANSLRAMATSADENEDLDRLFHPRAPVPLQAFRAAFQFCTPEKVGITMRWMSRANRSLKSGASLADAAAMWRLAADYIDGKGDSALVTKEDAQNVNERRQNQSGSN